MGGVTLGKAGIWRVLPSFPIRKAFAGSDLLKTQVQPEERGELQTERSPKPMPKEGNITMPTPLIRSK
jgi:hypothetical protein